MLFVVFLIKTRLNLSCKKDLDSFARISIAVIFDFQCFPFLMISFSASGHWHCSISYEPFCVSFF